MIKARTHENNLTLRSISLLLKPGFVARSFTAKEIIGKGHICTW